MTPKQIKGKLAVLNKPYVREVIYDAVEMYLYEVMGEPEEERLAETVEAIAKEMESRYKQQLPKKQPVVRNVDLEDSIRDIKAEKAKSVVTFIEGSEVEFKRVQ